MPFTICHRRRTYLWNPVSGTLTRLPALEAALLAEVPQPMPAVCPSAVRYAVAQYDGAAVDAAYAALRERLAVPGIEASGTPRLVLPAGTSPDLVEAILRAAMEAFPGKAIVLIADDDMRAVAASLGVPVADR